VVNGIEALGISRNINQLISLYEADAEPERIKEVKKRLVSDAESIFRDYDLPTDQKLFVAMMEMYGKNLGERWLAPEYKRIREMCKGDFGSLAGKIYPKSPFTSRERFISFVNGFSKNSIKKAKNDIFYLLANDIADFLSRNVRDELTRINSEIQQLNRIYMAAQMEFEPDRVFYPDANSTLRVTYGQVKGYFSRDAVYFTHYTTLKGIMEKDNPEIYDYNVPEKLRELYRKRDFGRYTQDGEVPVCFIANNHTTGGNSGSPVINAEGHLIGVNFDRAWEGVASDMAFNPEQSRNISLDIRYALFIIDKFAGAGYLLKEMTIIE